MILDAISFNFIPDSKFLKISHFISKVMVFLVFVDLFFKSNLPISVTVIGHKILKFKGNLENVNPITKKEKYLL